MGEYDVVMYTRSIGPSCESFQFIPHTVDVNVTLLPPPNASWTSFDVFAQLSCVDKIYYLQSWLYTV